MLIYCQWRTTLMHSTVSYCNHGRPQEFLQDGAKSIPSHVFPCLSILIIPPLPVHPALSPLCPECPLFSAVKRIALIQLGVCGSNVRIFWAMNVSCGNDFGTFRAKQNVVTESTYSRAGQVPLLSMPASARDCNTKVNVQNRWSHVISFTEVDRTVYQLNDRSSGDNIQEYLGSMYAA